MAADETPAQPDEPLGYCTGCGWVRQRGAVCPECGHDPAQSDAAPAPDEVTPATEHVTRADMDSARRITDGGPWSADGSVAPAPDGNAGGADVYRDAEAAWLDALFGDRPHGPITLHMSGERHFRAAIDAARAPLLAEVERLRLVVAEMRREADAQFAIWRAETDEARAKTDGGEWQWGVRWNTARKPVDWLGGDEADVRRYVAARPDGTAELVRRWIGPVEPVTDDGGEHA